MSKVLSFLMLGATILVSGCIESTTLLDVDRDGSGKVVVREFFSPQITQMMEGVGGMFAGMGGEQGEKTKPAKEEDIFADMIKSKTESLGGGVKLVKSERLQNKQGWKGYKATYSFKDINDLTITVDSSEGSEEGAIGQSAEPEKETNLQYAFDFTSGDTAILKVIPLSKPESSESTVTVENSEDKSDAADQMGDQMMTGMSGMMGTMLKGMRMAFIIRVEGDIKKTNAAYTSTKHPNVITVMDMPVDKMVSNPAAMKILQANDEDSLAKLEEMNIDGLKIEDPEKTIEIEF